VEVKSFDALRFNMAVETKKKTRTNGPGHKLLRALQNLHDAVVSRDSSKLTIYTVKLPTTANSQNLAITPNANG